MFLYYPRYFFDFYLVVSIDFITFAMQMRTFKCEEYEVN